MKWSGNLLKYPRQALEFGRLLVDTLVVKYSILVAQIRSTTLLVTLNLLEKLGINILVIVLGYG